MKYIGLFILALSASSVANAELSADTTLINFYDVSLDFSSTKEFTVMNVGTLAVNGITVSITGNSSEFSWSGCDGASLAPEGGSCTIYLTLAPLHYGKKHRKLNIDGYETIGEQQNDVTLTIPVIGSSDPPPPNKP